MSPVAKAILRTLLILALVLIGLLFLVGCGHLAQYDRTYSLMYTDAEGRSLSGGLELRKRDSKIVVPPHNPDLPALP
jgi:hypothetical protein